MGCFRFFGKRKDRLLFSANRQDRLLFRASLICSVVSDKVKGFFFGADGKAFAGADGKFFAGKNQKL